MNFATRRDTRMRADFFKGLREYFPIMLLTLMLPAVTKVGDGWHDVGVAVLMLAGLFALLPTLLERISFWRFVAPIPLGVSMVTLLSLMHRPGVAGAAPWQIWWAVISLWVVAWLLTNDIARRAGDRTALGRAATWLAPAIFGLTILFLWEAIVVGFGVPFVLMPPPSAIGARFFASLPTLREDFIQTVLKSVLPGWALGSALGFAVALLCDRIPFLKRGLLPLGQFASALPIIGVAPIMVMWFGFDWPSKVAVVVIMTFFPMLVNAVAGLAAAGALERDLMRSYAADWTTTLLKLRLPAATPFIFNALKINSTLAMIGAIVAEFFGTPIVGMGFRISTEAGRLGLDMVWAEIMMAAIAGSAFYGAIALVERAVAFWHPSFRGRA